MRFAAFESKTKVSGRKDGWLGRRQRERSLPVDGALGRRQE
jgi:hypothetical protein